ncbi:MAG: lytic transglycosylase domain-containing protein [Verrucomicrobiota bacterium]
MLIAAALVAVGILLYRSPDPLYTAQETISFSRFHRYDALIESLARKHAIDPLLVKAVVWRESSFDAKKVGKDGERGLMQVMPDAANDWVRAKKIETFVMTDLFDPKTNIDAGTWYLKQALQRYNSKDDPLTFALTEYNAGRTRVDRWIADSNMGSRATASDLRGAMKIESTRRYVDTIIDRYKFYQNREREQKE